MKVHLTFDIEVWCNGWENLDSKFPAAFARYVYGHSPAGDFALPETLEILNRNGLHGIFFIEPLFAARFGLEHLDKIVRMIRDAGQEVQLHLHPEWTDEIRPLLFAGASKKRQHLCYYTLEEQIVLIKFALELIGQVCSEPITAFRAGSFSCNRDTFRALTHLRVPFDSSIHALMDCSAVGMRETHDVFRAQTIDGVHVLPLTMFDDGFRRTRPAQIGACSYGELRSALESAQQQGNDHFVILSHNFEMLKQGQSVPDLTVVRRFTNLCEYLGRNRLSLATSSFSMPTDLAAPDADACVPVATISDTITRYAEQAIRRLAG
jgi:peptidoglycan/xylan/chitin deacetylase (PgdA/CDA1 family)